MEIGTVEYTKSDMRRRASYDIVVKWVQDECVARAVSMVKGFLSVCSYRMHW